MDDIYCVGLCPLCKGNGMLHVIRIDGELLVECDECYLKFKNPNDAKRHQGWWKPEKDTYSAFPYLSCASSISL